MGHLKKGNVNRLDSDINEYIPKMEIGCQDLYCNVALDRGILDFESTFQY